MKQHFPLKNAQQEKRIYRSRVLISMGIVIFFMLLLVSRYAYLQLFNFESFTTASDENRIRLQPLPPARGYIYDRNGVLLADNYPVFTATLSRADVQDIDQTLERLKPILELTEEDLERFQTRIKTARKTERVSIKLNLNDILKKGDISQNHTLAEGDLLYLTSNGRIDFQRDVMPFISGAYMVSEIQNNNN